LSLNDNNALSLVRLLRSPAVALRTLNLRNNKISSVGLIQIAANLRTLHTLDVSCNSVADDGVATLCAVLTQPGAQLVQLHLGACYLTTSAIATPLSELLATSTTLCVLDISRNGLGDAGAKLCTAALLQQPHSGLRALYFGRNRVTAAGAAYFAALLEGNSSLVVLDLSGNTLHEDGLAILAGALQANTTLSCLAVDNCLRHGKALPPFLPPLNTRLRAHVLAVNTAPARLRTTLQLLEGLVNTLLVDERDLVDTPVLLSVPLPLLLSAAVRVPGPGNVALCAVQIAWRLHALADVCWHAKLQVFVPGRLGAALVCVLLCAQRQGQSRLLPRLPREILETIFGFVVFMPVPVARHLLSADPAFRSLVYK
jgi:hypothetical protein